MKNLILSFFLLSLFAIPNESIAQPPAIDELLEKPKKYKDKWYAPPGRNEIRNWQIKKGHCSAADYVMPKKVGILTVYIQDDARYLYTAGGWSTFQYATPDGVNDLAQTIFTRAYDDIKSSFESRGMELYQPWEYLDSKEKMDAYVNYEMGGGMATKWLQKKLVDNKLDGYAAVVAGYKFIPLHQSFQDNKFRKSFNELLVTLGMDAYLVISINMSGGDQIDKMDATIHYKNPAYGSETVYGAFSENIPVSVKGSFSNILVKEEQMKPNKKGKMKKQMVTVDINPVASTVMAQLVEGTCRTLETWIKDYKKKKK